MTADHCPFCNSDNAKDVPVRDGHLVRCFDCGASGPPAAGQGPDDRGTRDRAIAAWNRRAGDPVVLSAEEETALVGKARELVAAAYDVCKVIALPTLKQSADQVQLVLLGEGVDS